MYVSVQIDAFSGKEKGSIIRFALIAQHTPILDHAVEFLE
jgi:hypothetical protein